MWRCDMRHVLLHWCTHLCAQSVQGLYLAFLNSIQLTSSHVKNANQDANCKLWLGSLILDSNWEHCIGLVLGPNREWTHLAQVMPNSCRLIAHNLPGNIFLENFEPSRSILFENLCDIWTFCFAALIKHGITQMNDQHYSSKVFCRKV